MLRTGPGTIGVIPAMTRDPSTSYLRLLTWVCRRTKPCSIVEWGPGVSTDAMAKCCPEATIHSYEHDPMWYRCATERLRVLANVKLHLHAISLSPGSSTGYVTAPLRDAAAGSFDLAFVDGRLRCDCLTFAWFLLKQGGVAVLHDAERTAYHAALAMYPVRLIDKQWPQTIAAWKDPTAVPPSLPEWLSVMVV